MKAKTSVRFGCLAVILLYAAGYLALRSTHRLVQTFTHAGTGSTTTTHTHFETQEPLGTALFYVYYPPGWADHKLTGRGYELVDRSSGGEARRTFME